MAKRGPKPKVTSEGMILRIAKAVEGLMMRGFPGNTAFEAVLWALKEDASFRGRGLRMDGGPPGVDTIKAIHLEHGHRVRSSFDPEREPPPGFIGKWPPSHRWRYTKASLERLRPAPIESPGSPKSLPIQSKHRKNAELRAAQELALSFLREDQRERRRPTVRMKCPVDGEWYEEDADIAVGWRSPPLELTPKAEAELAKMPRLAARRFVRKPLRVVLRSKK
jgi:hypothetical protein